MSQAAKLSPTITELVGEDFVRRAQTEASKLAALQMNDVGRKALEGQPEAYFGDDSDSPDV